MLLLTVPGSGQGLAVGVESEAAASASSGMGLVDRWVVRGGAGVVVSRWRAAWEEGELWVHVGLGGSGVFGIVWLSPATMPVHVHL